MKVPMTYSKQTKSTYVFVSTDERLRTVYIAKSAFDEQPQSITVTVEVAK